MSEKIQEAKGPFSVRPASQATAVSQGSLCRLRSAGAGLGSRGDGVSEMELFELLHPAYVQPGLVLPTALDPPGALWVPPEAGGCPSLQPPAKMKWQPSDAVNPRSAPHPHGQRQLSPTPSAASCPPDISKPSSKTPGGSPSSPRPKFTTALDFSSQQHLPFPSAETTILLLLYLGAKTAAGWSVGGAHVS